MMRNPARAHEGIDPAPRTRQECRRAIYVDKASHPVATRHVQTLSYSPSQLINELVVKCHNPMSAHQPCPTPIRSHHPLDDAHLRPAPALPVSFSFLPLLLSVTKTHKTRVAARGDGRVHAALARASSDLRSSVVISSRLLTA
jgi:hypothetical protein